MKFFALLRAILQLPNLTIQEPNRACGVLPDQFLHEVAEAHQLLRHVTRWQPLGQLERSHVPATRRERPPARDGVSKSSCGLPSSGPGIGERGTPAASAIATAPRQGEQSDEGQLSCIPSHSARSVRPLDAHDGPDDTPAAAPPAPPPRRATWRPCRAPPPHRGNPGPPAPRPPPGRRGARGNRRSVVLSGLRRTRPVRAPPSPRRPTGPPPGPSPPRGNALFRAIGSPPPRGSPRPRPTPTRHGRVSCTMPLQLIGSPPVGAGLYVVACGTTSTRDPCQCTCTALTPQGEVESVHPLH